MNCWNRHSYLFLLLVLIIGSGLPVQAAPLSVFTTLPPHADLVQRIGGESVQVTALFSAGETPHTFSHTPRQIQALSECSLLYIAGTLPVERRLLSKLPPNRAGGRVVDLSRGISLRVLEDHDHDHNHDHDHDHDHDNDHAGEALMEGDPHIWLGPQELIIQAEHIARTLSDALPEQGAVFAKRLAQFKSAMAEADRHARDALSPYRGKSVLVFHPAFGYFLDTYGLEQATVEMHGKAPTPKQVRDTIKFAKAEGITILFVQPGFDQKSAQVIAAAIGGTVVQADPIPADVLGNMRALTEKFATALR